MDVMKELYEKVAKDDKLQAKFNEILKDMEKEGTEEQMKKLQSFAKEAGYEVTPEEIRVFFKNLAENQSGPLSDTELDMVAGGKSIGGISNIVTSVFSLGVEGAFASSMTYITGGGDACKKLFE